MHINKLYKMATVTFKHSNDIKQDKMFSQIYDMLKDGKNPMPLYKNFIYNMHQVSPLVNEKWTYKLHNFSRWRQIMKDYLKDRDMPHTKNVINGYGHQFIDFDGEIVKFVCKCGKHRTENSCCGIISPSEIGDPVYNFMLCHCMKKEESDVSYHHAF